MHSTLMRTDRPALRRRSANAAKRSQSSCSSPTSHHFRIKHIKGTIAVPTSAMPVASLYTPHHYWLCYLISASLLIPAATTSLKHLVGMSPSSPRKDRVGSDGRLRNRYVASQRGRDPRCTQRCSERCVNWSQCLGLVPAAAHLEHT